MKKSMAILVLVLISACQPDDPRLNSDPLVQCMAKLKTHTADLTPYGTPPEELRGLRMMLGLGTAGAKNLAREHNSGKASDDKYDEFLHQCQDVEESLGLRTD